MYIYNLPACLITHLTCYLSTHLLRHVFICTCDLKSIWSQINLIQSEMMKKPSFTSEVFQNVKEYLIPMIFRLFQETEETDTLSKSFYEAKTERDTTRKENY